MTANKKIQKLISEVDLGDKRPTQLLNELSGLTKGKINNDFLKSLRLAEASETGRQNTGSVRLPTGCSGLKTTLFR